MDGRFRQHHPSRGARPNVRHLPFLFSVIPRLHILRIGVLLVELHDPRPATPVRPASKIAPRYNKFKHLFFARNRHTPPTLSSLSSDVTRSFTTAGSPITNLTIIRSGTYVVPTTFFLPLSFGGGQSRG
jgi:hypothetical protein